jgi:hypothetical protein
MKQERERERERENGEVMTMLFVIHDIQNKN